MAAAKTFRWPGSSALHTVSWEDQKAAVAARHPGAAAAAPAAPAGPLVMPVDPTYQSDVGTAQRTRDTSLANVSQQRTSGLLGYGYGEDAATGALTFDPNNAFSKAMLLKKNYDQSRARTAQSIGSTGGLYTGAAQKAQDLVNIGQVGAEDSLQKSLLSFLAQNTQATANAGANYENAVGAADASRVGRIADNPLYMPASSTAAPAPAVAAPPPKGGVGTAVTKTKPKTKKPKTVTYTTGVKTP